MCAIRSVVAEFVLSAGAYDITFIIYQQFVHESCAADFDTSSIDVKVIEGLVPNAEFVNFRIEAAACRSGEGEVAEATHTGVGRIATCLFRSIDIDRHFPAFHDDGDVLPFFQFQCSGGVAASTDVPTCGQCSVGVGMEHELSPAGTGTLIPVGERVTLHPEFDGDVFADGSEDAGNGEAGVAQVNCLVLCGDVGHFDGDFGRFRRAIDGGDFKGPLCIGRERIGFLVGAQFREHLVVFVDFIRRHGAC